MNVDSEKGHLLRRHSACCYRHWVYRWEEKYRHLPRSSGSSYTLTAQICWKQTGTASSPGALKRVSCHRCEVLVEKNMYLWFTPVLWLTSKVKGHQQKVSGLNFIWKCLPKRCGRCHVFVKENKMFYDTPCPWVEIKVRRSTIFILPKSANQTKCESCTQHATKLSKDKCTHRKKDTQTNRHIKDKKQYAHSIYPGTQKRIFCQLTLSLL